MKKIIFLSMIAILFTSSIKSQTRGFGIGIVLGEPTGLSAKLWTGNSNAFDFAAAWSFRGSGHVLLQADYVWHTANLLTSGTGRLPFYYGIGGRIILADDPLLGVRIPLGLNYQFSEAPLDIFVEIVPILDLTPETDFDVGGGLGIRFWF
jgi:hypothetical protein